MTLLEAMETADRLAGNRIEDRMKVRWLSELDGTIQREILQGRVDTGFRGYDETTEPDRKLLVPEPYDGIYRWYLEMQLHDAGGEILKYNNAAQKFNSALLAYGDYVNRSLPPVQSRGLRLW